MRHPVQYVIKNIFIIGNLFSTGGELTKSKRCQLVSTLFGEELSEFSLQGDQGNCDNYGYPQQMLVLPHRVIVCGLLLVKSGRFFTD